MLEVKSFTFNPFQENTYIVYDASKECLIIDPGCDNSSEEFELTEFVRKNDLKPVRLLNTHCHIDHILGNNFISNLYQIGLEIPEMEVNVLKEAPEFARFFGVRCNPQPNIKRLIKEGEEITFGFSKFSVLFTPGHSPGSVCFFNNENNILIAGDVLFKGSIGRYDLPGANGHLLMESIVKKICTLPEQTIVYPGHGPSTTIGYENKNNPYILEYKMNPKLFD